jgi:hypothetical protein
LASRGFAYLKLNRYQAAITEFDAGLQLNPGDPHLLFGGGMPSTDVVAAEATMPVIVDEMAKLGVQLQNFWAAVITSWH